MASPQPRVGVITYPGSQDDRDALWALAAVDAEAVPVWHEERDLPDLDAVVLPGGFGAAINLSTFASKGEDAEVNPDVARLLREMHAAKKPIGAICIAPALVAKALGFAHPRLTVGNDRGVAQKLEACGAVHEDCPVDAFVVDRENRIVSTPAYMLGPSIRHVAEGIERCVAEVLSLVKARERVPAAR